MSDPTRSLPSQSAPNATPHPHGRDDGIDAATIDPSGAAVAAAPPDPPPGYELMEEIGQGGMGIVYRARDIRLNRSVAVKTLHDRYAPGSLAARRFLDEARITAQLQHPCIPPIHEVGTLPNGRPFLAMKLIKGQTLAERLADSTGGRGASLAAFELVCQAVAYAHDHGVIHRDLKPQNVMIGAFGEVQVMDWGLAKFRGDARAESAAPTDLSTFHDPRDDTDEELRTRTGSFLGTPAYMPPEQAIGAIEEIDERSDVFGLGAVLCVILTGQPPYVGETPKSTRQLAAQGKLDDAFARLDVSGTEPELVALCKRCLSPQKTDRPRNAGKVAAAVEAFRAESEERARQAEVNRVRAEGERAKAEMLAAEQRKRRTVQLALAGAVLLLAAGGFAFAWYSDREASRQSADELRRQIEDDRIAGETREREARNRDAMVASLERCEKALRQSDADAAALALAESRKRLTEAGVGGFAGRVERCRADLALLQELDGIDAFRWTPTGGSIPEPPAVAARWRRAFAAVGIVPGETEPTVAARKVGESLVQERMLGALDLWLVAGGEPALTEILAAADPDAYRDAMRQVVRADLGWPVRIVAAQKEALAQPARFAVAMGDNESIAAPRRRAVLLRAATGRPDDVTILMALGGTYPIDQVEGAADRVRWYQAAVAVHPRSLAAQNNLGLALQDQGQAGQAVEIFERVLAVHPEFAPARNNLGSALNALGRWEAAIVEYRRAIALDPDRARPHYNLGNVLREHGRIGEAIAEYERAIALDPDFARAHSNLGMALRALDRVDEAIAAYRRAIELDPRLVQAHINLSVALRLKGRNDEAIAECKRAIELDPRSAQARVNLGVALRDMGRPEEAAIEYRRAIKLDPKLAQAHTNLGAVYLDQGKYPEAIACARAAIAADAKLATAHAMLGDLLLRTGDVPGARRALAEAARLDRRWAGMLAKLPPLDIAPPPRSGMGP